MTPGKDPALAYPLLCLLGLVLLSGVGFGPSLHLVSKQNSRRVSTALFISPAIGLAIIALIAYPLFLNSIPLDRVLVPLTVIPLGFSGTLLIIDIRAHRSEYSKLLSRKNSLYLAVFGVVFFLLVIPAYVGGDQYRYWQSTPADARNYWSWTYFVQHIPFRDHNISNPDMVQNAIQFNPGLMAAFSSNGAAAPVRIVVEQPLAWLCLLFNIPIYEFYYYFKLLAALITFFTALAVAKRFNLPPGYSLSLGIILATGFWTWYVIDIDALSHVYTLPLGMLFIFAWVQLEEENPTKRISRQRLLFSLSFSALLGYYPEIIPLIIIALALYYGKYFFDFPGRSSLKRIEGVFITLGITAVLVLPSLGQMINDLIHQTYYAASLPSNVNVNYYYSWFYTREMLTRQIWGLYYYDSQAPIITLVLTAITLVLGVILIAGVLRSAIKQETSAKTSLISALFVAFWGSGLAIYIVGNNWVAGKAIAMGYTFTFVALFFFMHSVISDQRIRRVIRLIPAISLLTWSMLQFAIPVIRAKHFANDQEFENYVPLQSPIGDIVPVINYLHQNPAELLVSYFQPNLSSYFSPVTNIGWEMMLSDQFRHYTMRGFTSAYISGPIQYWQDIDEAPSHLLFDSEENYLQALGVGTQISVLDTPMRLYSVTPEELNQTVFTSNLLLDEHKQGFATNALRLLTDTSGPYRAVESREGHIRSLAGSDSPISIFLEYSVEVPSSISMYWNNGDLLERTPIEPGSIQQFGRCVSMSNGSNDLVIHYVPAIDDPSVAPLKIYRFQIAPTDNFLVNVGGVNDGMYLSTGWNGPEIYEETGVRWATQTAQFKLFTCEQTDYVLHFRALALDEGRNQHLTVVVNGTALRPIEIQPDFNEYEAVIPSEMLSSDGIQTITFEHAYSTVPPGDTRELAVMYDSIRLTPRCQSIDVGSVDDGLNNSVGWNGSEMYEGTAVRWASQTASLTLFTCEQTDHILHFRTLALEVEPHQRLIIMVNGSALQPIELQPNFNEYEVIIPLELLNADGEQAITLEHAYTIMPSGDTRELAAMYDWIEFEPVE